MGDLAVTVVVSTFGDLAWRELAESRAVPSALDQAPVIRVHGETLHGARNDGLAKVETDAVLFLDADDALDEGFVEAMSHGTADLRCPMLHFVKGGHERPWQPRVHGHEHDCVAECIASGAGNWMPAGTVMRTELVREVGGWREWAVYEDFDLAMRLLLASASIELVREARYRAWVNPQSRNRAPSMTVKNATHRAIVEANRECAAA